MNMGCVTVFGGTGFLGRAIVNRLAATGTTVRVAARHPGPTNVSGATARCAIVQSVCADVRDEASVARALKELGAMHVARQSARAGLKALVHMSGIGADLNSESSYVRSRARGERLVSDAFPAATILRPSVLFGPEDKFLNSLASAVRWSPVVGLFGAGDTRLQPVYVGDVAEAVLRVLATPPPQGKLYELGGPRIYRYRELIELVASETGRSRILMPLPFLAWHALARLLMLLPNAPLTTDVVTLMRRDNVVGDGVLTFSDLGLAPTAIEAVLPVMLGARS